jgi:chromosome segregation ATPase
MKREITDQEIIAAAQKLKDEGSRVTVRAIFTALNCRGSMLTIQNAIKRHNLYAPDPTQDIPAECINRIMDAVRSEFLTARDLAVKSSRETIAEREADNESLSLELSSMTTKRDDMLEKYEQLQEKNSALEAAIKTTELNLADKIKELAEEREKSELLRQELAKGQYREETIQKHEENIKTLQQKLQEQSFDMGKASAREDEIQNLLIQIKELTNRLQETNNRVQEEIVKATEYKTLLEKQSRLQNDTEPKAKATPKANKSVPGVQN